MGFRDESLSQLNCSNSSGSSDDSGDLGLPKRVTSRPANRRPSLARSDASKTAVEKALSRYHDTVNSDNKFD